MARVQLMINDPGDAVTLRTLLQGDGHDIVQGAPDVVLTDDLVRAISAAGEAPVLILTPFAQVRDAIRAMKEGAYGYILKPLQPGEAQIMVRRAAASGHAGKEVEWVPEPLEAVEERHIQAMLRYCRHNRGEAARRLGIARNTLWRKLKRMEEKEDGPQ